MVIRLYENGYRPTPAEYRRLRRDGQKANARVKTATKKFKIEWGAKYVPQELVGYWTSQNRWASETTAISTSMKQFSTKDDFNSFMAKINRVNNGQSLKDFAKNEHKTTVKAILNKLGTRDASVEEYIETMVGRMNASDIGAFWELFEEQSAQMGQDFDSDEALLTILSELYGEDLKAVLERSYERTKSESTKGLLRRI